MKKYLKLILVFFFLLPIHSVYSQNNAIIIWCNYTSSKVIYPIVISNDSIREEFSDKYVKYRNIIPVGYRYVSNVVLDVQKIETIIEFLNLKYDIYQGSAILDNKNLNLPEISYVVNDSIQRKLVLTNPDIFISILNSLLEYSRSILSKEEYFALEKAVYRLYNDMAYKYYEKE